MSTYIFILGKDPDLSLMELQSRYGLSKAVTQMGHFVITDLNVDMNQDEFDTLGGQIKAGKVIGKVNKRDLVEGLADHLSFDHESGKLNYGISLYGWSEKNLRSLLLNLKKEFKKCGVSSRFANQDFINISAAQHKGLKGGKEMLVCKDKNDYLIAEVVAVQDIDAYSKRDFKKPFRDMKVGMLPPKLAQILINLTGKKGRIWDPFCGGGVLIMEGLLMGHDMIGSDININTLEGAVRNVEWVQYEFGDNSTWKLLDHDARDPFETEKFDAIACEGYLGPPQSRLKYKKEFVGIIKELTSLYVDFFKALGNFKGPVVIALPFYRTKEGELHLEKAVKGIENLGFKKNLNLKYARQDQIVGRDIFRFS